MVANKWLLDTRFFYQPLWHLKTITLRKAGNTVHAHIALETVLGAYE